MQTRIRSLRHERGWTQPQLAQKAGLDPSTVKNIETGAILHPSPLSLGKLASAFGLSVEDLFTQETSQADHPPVSFSSPLRALRHERGWTQAQLAAQAGVSIPAIKRLEAGHAVPLPQTLKKLSLAFGLSVEDLSSSSG